MKKVTKGTILERLSRFLFNFRFTPSASTGISPAIAMFGRPLRTRLDLLRDIQPHGKEEGSSFPNKFKEDTSVWVHSFGHGPSWIPGSVVRPIGKVMSEINVPWGTCRRHHNQLCHRHEAISSELSSQPATSTPLIPQAELIAGLFSETVHTSDPPVHSLQVNMDNRKNNSSMTPPELMLQVVQRDSKTPFRHSKRLKQKPICHQF